MYCAVGYLAHDKPEMLLVERRLGLEEDTEAELRLVDEGHLCALAVWHDLAVHAAYGRAAKARRKLRQALHGLQQEHYGAGSEELVRRECPLPEILRERVLLHTRAAM